MKIKLLSIFWILLFAVSLSATTPVTIGYHRYGQVTARAYGSPYLVIQPNAVVYVTSTSTGGDATIYSDPLLTVAIASSSVTADVNGNYSYYMPLNYCVNERIAYPGSGSVTSYNLCGNTGVINTPVVPMYGGTGASTAAEGAANLVNGNPINPSSVGVTTPATTLKGITVTDGTASLHAGSLTGAVNGTFSGTVAAGSTNPVIPAACATNPMWSANVKEVTPQMCGAKADGLTDDSAAFNAALATGLRVHVPAGTYAVNITIPNAGFDIVGDGMSQTILAPYSTATPAVMDMGDPGNANFWRRSSISNLSIQGSGGVGWGFTFGNPASYVAGNERIGRVDMTNVEITGFNKGVFKTAGNIGNTFANCRVQNNNYNYYAQSSNFASVSAAAMHSGFDSFYSGAWGYAGLAGIFIRDEIAGKGGWTFKGVDLEGNTGYAVVALALPESASGTFDYAPDLVFDSSWFEANATGGPITIDGLSGSITGTPYWMYVSGVKHVAMRNEYLGTIYLANGSNMIAENSTVDTITPVFSLTMDAASTFVNNGVASNTCFTDQLVLAPYATDIWPTLANTATACSVQPTTTPQVVNDYTVRAGYSFRDLLTNTGTSSASTLVVDGLTFPYSNQYAGVTIAAYANPIPAATITTGKYYAVSFQARLVSGPAVKVIFPGLSSGTGIPVDSTEWRQFNMVATPNSSAGATSTVAIFGTSASASVVNIGGIQIVEFTNINDAYNYLYKGRFATNNDTIPGATYAAAYKVSSNTVLPSDLTGYHGTGGTKVQLSDGTGATGDMAVFASDGSVTEGGAGCTYGTWTPIDISGASLTFAAGTGGTYVQCGKMVNAWFRVVYPTTSNGSSSSIGGLPIASGTGTASPIVGFCGYNSLAISSGLSLIGAGGGTAFAMYDAGDTLLTNTNLSTMDMRCTLSYETP